MIVLPPQIDEWHDLLEVRPPERILVEFMQRYETGFTTRWIGTLEELRPDFNITGLRWRLTGIGKAQIEARVAKGEPLVTMFIKPRAPKSPYMALGRVW